METPRTPSVSSLPVQLAAEAASRWDLDPASLEFVSATKNVVYRASLNAQPVYLRLTAADFHSVVENQAECDFLAYLDQVGLAVAMPLRSQRDRMVEALEDKGGLWSASLFANAPGDEIRPNDPRYTAAFVTEWGASLGRMHRAATEFRPVAGWERPDWEQDFWLRNALKFLPRDDLRARAEYETVCAVLHELPATATSYGMTHGDFAPQNFRYDPARGITAFDFGNCGYHWFMWDVATALSLVLWDEASHKAWFFEHFMAGYRREFEPGLELIAQLDWFLRLRMLVVYLARLWWFGPDPTPAQVATLARIRANVHDPVSWQQTAAPTWRG